mmetsp:Transcript_81866/g.230429  ORF Transcript_81866/g.230429 Transcript_81866/m.230429 type:complete len:203 (-) Transcript_81866:3-611(-)
MAPSPNVGGRTPTLARAQLQVPFLIGVQVVPALPHRARLLVHDVASSVPRVCHLVCTDLSGTAVCRGKVLESKFRAPGCKPRCASIHPVGPALEVDDDGLQAGKHAGGFGLLRHAQGLALAQRPRDALGVPAQSSLGHPLRGPELLGRRHHRAGDPGGRQRGCSCCGRRSFLGGEGGHDGKRSKQAARGGPRRRDLAKPKRD